MTGPSPTRGAARAQTPRPIVSGRFFLVRATNFITHVARSGGAAALQRGPLAQRNPYENVQNLLQLATAS